MMCGLKERDLYYIVEVLKKFPLVKRGLIFGSRAKGSHQIGSDVDLALLGDAIKPSTISDISYLLNEELPIPYFFDVVDYASIDEPNLKEHIDRVGKTIYSSTDF